MRIQCRIENVGSTGRDKKPNQFPTSTRASCRPNKWQTQLAVAASESTLDGSKSKVNARGDSLGSTGVFRKQIVLSRQSLAFGEDSTGNMSHSGMGSRVDKEDEQVRQAIESRDDALDKDSNLDALSGRRVVTMRKQGQRTLALLFLPYILEVHIHLNGVLLLARGVATRDSEWDDSIRFSCGKNIRVHYYKYTTSRLEVLVPSDSSPRACFRLFEISVASLPPLRLPHII